MQWDPLNLRRYGDDTHKKLMGFLAGAVLGLVLGLILIIIALSSSHSSQIGTVNSDVSSWNTDDVANAVKNLSLKMKIMPSQGRGVKEFMKWTDAESLEYGKMLNDGEISKYDISYFRYDGDTTLKFSSLYFNGDMVPVGDAQKKCVFVEWSLKEYEQRKESFKPLNGLPDCIHSKTGWWYYDDPKIGINVANWDQQTEYISCSGKNCESKCKSYNGWWVWNKDQTEGDCYVYKILNKICMVIAPSKDKFGEIEWNYVGGCFSDGPARYEDGIPGEIYKFDNVEIEVRHKEDPFVIAIGATDDNVHFSHSNTILWIFAIILVGAGAGCGALFLMNWRKLDSAGEGHARFNDES